MKLIGRRSYDHFHPNFLKRELVVNHLQQLSKAGPAGHAPAAHHPTSPRKVPGRARARYGPRVIASVSRMVGRNAQEPLCDPAVAHECLQE